MEQREQNKLVLVFLGLLAFLCILPYFLKEPGLGGSDVEPQGTSIGSEPQYSENTEDKLERVYTELQIEHDDQMIREDSRAVERLNREFGQ